MRFAFAGDRDIAVRVLDYLIEGDYVPLALLTPDLGRASHARELMSRCAELGTDRIMHGAAFRTPEGLRRLTALHLDLIVAVHFPLIVPHEVLAVPQIGVLNLHPALLPYNRGWHTATWAILEGTPIGATLHFMDEGVDSGDIVHQRALEVSPADTAHTLYRRLKHLEYDVFREAWPLIVAGKSIRMPQPAVAGSSHKRRDLFSAEVQRIDLDQMVRADHLIRRLRALSTDRTNEAAFYEVNGKRYRIRVMIEDEPSEL